MFVSGRFRTIRPSDCALAGRVTSKNAAQTWISIGQSGEQMLKVDCQLEKTALAVYWAHRVASGFPMGNCM